MPFIVQTKYLWNGPLPDEFAASLLTLVIVFIQLFSGLKALRTTTAS